MMSKELAKSYNPKDFEDRIYKYWNDSGCFKAEIDENKKPYTIVIPPPNITGQLHMGHALDETLQDILIRYKRMSGYSALWQFCCWRCKLISSTITFNLFIIHLNAVKRSGYILF